MRLMRFLKRTGTRRVARRTAAVGVEGLESRELLATSTAAIATGFIAPDLSSLIYRAVVRHQNTGPATIRMMENALQSQLNSGVLTALQGGTLTPANFSTSVANVVSSYETNVDQQLLPRFPNIDAILKGQAQSVLAVGNALNTQLKAGLITQTVYTTQAAQAINAITGGPLFPLNTNANGYAQVTTFLVNQLNLLPPALATGASPSLTLAQAKSIAIADAEAYRVPLNTALFTRPFFAGNVNSALNTFEASVNAITSTGSTLPAQQFTNAITTLDASLLGTSGLFGNSGLFRRNR
ncbi:MAG: hypothetical protein LC745_00615 [Planctomycetia bacterium]|nr:hypothetical protein [Planctomycetia bacterium]